MSDLVIRDALMQLPEYVPGKSIDSLRAELGLERIIKMASNENPLGPAVASISELSEAFTQYYPDISQSALLGDLASFYGLEPEQLILGNGSE